MEHEHNFAKRRRVDVQEIQTFDVYGTWIEVVEVWRYSCACGETKDVHLSLNDAPHIRKR